MDELTETLEFDWDEGNSSKSVIKYNVSKSEAEQVFFNNPLLIEEDILHSKIEIRYYCLGKTDSNRKLFISFTIRSARIRVISARPMNRKEGLIYENA